VWACRHCDAPNANDRWRCDYCHRLSRRTVLMSATAVVAVAALAVLFMVM
jgi:hypothetical protein